ncbi:CRTAC1 family protein, partial [bacterium]|nr:CRTAC1 family protein [bacterium]
VGDYDGDGLEDLCVAGRILRNKGGRRFEDTTERTGVRARGSPTPLWLDYDGDGMLDLLLGGLPSLALWRNYGDGTFVDVTGSMGLALRLPGLPSGLAAGDYDGDGLVDLFVACFETPGRLGVPRPNLLLRNTGRRFLDVTARAGLRGARFHSSRAAAWGDFNGDALQDLYVANGRLEPNQLWVNQGNGRFLERAAAAGVQGMLGRGRLSKSFGNTVACSWGDLNGDGAADVLVAEVIAVRYAGIVGASGLYLNGRRRGDWRFEDATPQCGIPFEEMPVGISMADFDNDGDLDVCRTAQGERRTMGLYRNDGRAHFMPITWRAGLVAFDCWGHGWFDKEGDGDLDLVVGGKRVRVFENKGNANAWLRVRLVGAGTNRGAVGARVTVHASEIKTQLVRDVVAGTGAGSQGSSILHFGLSKQRGQVRVSVRWPSGAMQKLDSVHVRQFLTVKEE